MARKKVISESGSFKGWDLWTWIKGNARIVTELKELIKAGISYGVGFLVTKDLITAAGAGLVVKFVMDTVEYYLKKYTT